MEALNKECTECGKQLRGRTDKKFCDDFCRNAFNNKLNSDTNTYVRNVINILRRNRRILEQFVKGKDDVYKTTKERLITNGFNFSYNTHTYTNRKGNVYYFCFEFGYLVLEGDWLLIVKRKEDVKD